jgi:diphthamide biosynthesis protein 3
LSKILTHIGNAQEELAAGEETARCPSCSLYITVIYNPEDFQENEEEESLRAPALQPIPAA